MDIQYDKTKREGHRPSPSNLETATTEERSVIAPQHTEGVPAAILTGLKKSFRRANGSVIHAVDDVSMTIREGEFVVLLGPSGCGKTTLLRSIAGLERPDEGEIDIAGCRVFSATKHRDLPPEDRRISMVFQSYALWPHLTVSKNVAYPLTCGLRGRLPRGEIARRVDHALALVGITELRDQRPANMSGGQQQRVALARALVAQRGLILFDEPLSNVDAKVRDQLRSDLRALQREIGFAAVYVTHDQAEAMQLADKVAVLRSGRILQYGSPTDIYHHPADRHVANFIGSSNEFDGQIAQAPDTEHKIVTTELGDIVARHRPDSPATAGTEVVVSWRQESGSLSVDEPERANKWLVKYHNSIFLGSSIEYSVTFGSQRIRIISHVPFDLGDQAEVWLTVAPEDVRVFSR